MTCPTPIDPDALLTRDQTAKALTDHGFPTKANTLATKATRGGGPQFQRFGARPLYRWGAVLQWARSRLGPPVGSTSEAHAHMRALRARRTSAPKEARISA
jgi:hypothetical protein